MALSIQPDDRILVVGGGCCSKVGEYVFRLARYYPDGSLDTSFGDQGFVTTHTIRFQGPFSDAVVFGADGSIFAAGFQHYSNERCSCNAFAVVKLSPTRQPRLLLRSRRRGSNDYRIFVVRECRRGSGRREGRRRWIRISVRRRAWEVRRRSVQRGWVPRPDLRTSWEGGHAVWSAPCQGCGRGDRRRRSSHRSWDCWQAICLGALLGLTPSLLLLRSLSRINPNEPQGKSNSGRRRGLRSDAGGAVSRAPISVLHVDGRTDSERETPQPVDTTAQGLTLDPSNTHAPFRIANRLATTS